MRRLSWALGALCLAVTAGLGLAFPAAAQAPVPDTTTTPDPSAVASRAAAAWSAPEPRIRTNPPPTRAQVAGLATWLWVEPPGPLRFSSTDGPTTVALEARAREVRFELGDGATLTCAGTGVPYDASRPESAQSSACTHAWEATSGGETLQVRATVTWDIFFEGRPVGTEAASSGLDVAVAEAQALDRRPDPLSGAEGDAGAAADADSGGRPLDELGELVPEKDKGCGFNPFCWGGKGLNALGDLAGGAWDGAKALATQVGGFFVGVVKGFGGLVAELFTVTRGISKLFGAYDLVDWVITGDGAFDEFKDTWAGLSDGVKHVFTTNPLTTLKGIGMGVWEPIRDSWRSGDYGEAVGRGAFDALVAVLGTKGLSKAGKLKGAKGADVPDSAPKPKGPLVQNPGKWGAAKESMSPRAAAYQSQVTGAKPGQVYYVKGVKFDGVSNGTLLEAKGPGYATFVRGGKFEPWFNGAEQLVDQARRQLAVAGDNPVRWAVAEEEAFTAIRNLLRSRGISEIEVVHVPATVPAPIP